MLDIQLFRDADGLRRIKESQAKRFRNLDYPDKVVEYDRQWREKLQERDELRGKRNALSKQIGALRKEGKDTSALQSEVGGLKEKIAAVDKEVEELLALRDEYRYAVGNLLHPDVPVGENEEANVVVREWGELPSFAFTPKSHVDLVETVDGADIAKASEVSGSRFYYLKNDLVLLNLALIHFAIDTLVGKGFSPVWTPFLLRREVIAEAAELADFEEQLYKVKDDDLYLIATSEQTLAAYHRGELLDIDSLPLKYCGVSSCFRREAGSHGKDTRGIFRVHQFEKVEQFVYCTAEESWELHEHLITNAEEIYQQLGLPYRVVDIASGEMNDNAARKYDLEAWFPGSGAYRELVSCSNCLDYQARKLNVKYGKIGGAPKDRRVVHTLNSTAIATERTICCILENYQNEDGTVRVPEVLRKYMGGRELMGKAQDSQRGSDGA
ncbi:MAG: serine--tRNA ligase [Promethearchaeota archaeon]